MLRHMGGDGTAASRARPSGWQGAPIAPEQHSIASSLFLVLQLAAPSAMLLQRLLASAGAASLRSGFAGGASQLIRSAPRTLPSLQQRRELTCSPVCMGRQASGPHRVLPHVLVIPGSSMYACAAVDATAAGRSLPPLPAAAATAAAHLVFRGQHVAPCRRSAKIATRKGKADAQKAKLYGAPASLELGWELQPSQPTGWLPKLVWGAAPAWPAAVQGHQCKQMHCSSAARHHPACNAAPACPQARLASRLRRRCGRAGPTKWPMRGCVRRWLRPRWRRQARCAVLRMA